MGVSGQSLERAVLSRERRLLRPLVVDVILVRFCPCLRENFSVPLAIPSHGPTQPHGASMLCGAVSQAGRLGRAFGHRRWHVWIPGEHRLLSPPEEKLFLPPDPREPASTRAVMLWLVGPVASGPPSPKKYQSPRPPTPPSSVTPSRRGSGSGPDRHCQPPPSAMGTSSTSPSGAAPWLLSPVPSVP